MYRVIWQYGVDVIGSLHSENLRSPSDVMGSYATTLRDLPTLSAPEPIFPSPVVTLRARTLAATPGVVDNPLHDLAAYQHVFVMNRDAADELRDRLLDDPRVLHSEVQPRPSPPFRIDLAKEVAGHELAMASATLQPAPTPNLRAEQVYLAPSPDGIGVDSAWQVPGGRGEGVSIVDVEWGWNFQHEDLRRRQSGVIHGISRNDDHGTAVLGIFSGDRNGFGIEGISSAAWAQAASPDYAYTTDPHTGRWLGKWNAACVIYAMADRLNAGDVILLEMHGPGPNSPEPPDEQSQQGFVPVEYWQAEFAAISYATSRGIYVVEAGGNGGENLDDPVYDDLFQRNARDSGAILVGGGASSLRQQPRSRKEWSNYGSRLDVQGWGEDVVTAGGKSEWYYHDRIFDEDAERCYTQSFSGTSAASPIVAGAVASLSGALQAAGRPFLSPTEMRELLRSTGTPQSGSLASPVSQQIGPLPNLHAALQAIQL